MVIRCKIIYLLLLLTYSVASDDEIEDRISTSFKPPDKLVLQKSQPYKPPEQPSFLSRIANWIYPFGSSSDTSSDSVPAEGHHGGPQYLPPPPHQKQQQKCNPCNQAPWIPVASNVGQKTILNFVPPSSSQHFQPPPLPQYGAPPVFKPKPEKLNYGLPIYGPPPRVIPATFAPAIEDLRPPLPPPAKTYLKPVQQDFGASIGMRPPPVRGGIYHSLPPTLPSFQYGPPGQNLPPPPPPPSDSYGAPVSGPNSEFQLRPEFLPIEVPSSNGNGFDVDRPIPLPNLSYKPVLPLRDAQDFHHHDNLPQYNEPPDVQVVPSIKIAEFLSSVEHPINVIQSPLVEVSVTNNDQKDNHESDVRPGGFYEQNSARLNDNPIVVEDTHTAASAINVTYQNSNLAEEQNANLPVPSSTQASFRSEPGGHEELLNNEFIQQFLLMQQSGQSPQVNEESKSFTQPPMDYSKWEPSWSVSTSMVPPPLGSTSTWLYPVKTRPFPSTTKKPKQIQIIIPYVNSKKPTPFKGNQGRRTPSNSYTTLLPVYSPPVSSQESIWSKFAEDFRQAESKKVTATAFTPPPPSTTQVYNIKDLLKDTQNFYPSEKLPFDVISLQNNIDDWTQQEFSKSYGSFTPNLKSTTKFVPSKKIPNDYFTTQPYHETTTARFDHVAASSNKDEKKLSEDIDSNLIFTDTTTQEIPTTTQSAKEKKSLWDVTSVTVSPLTKEKVYIVTPQPVIAEKSTPMSAWSLPPRVQNLKNASTTASTAFATPKFLVRVEPENRESREKLQQNFSPLTVVFSEWPHLINNLQTTTTRKPTSQHPLLGLMDLSAYTPPPNSTVQTISGHSKVVTVVTPSSVTEKKAKVV